MTGRTLGLSKLGLSGMEILWHGGQILKKHQVDRRWKDGLHTDTCARVCVSTSAVNRRAFPKLEASLDPWSPCHQSCKGRLE